MAMQFEYDEKGGTFYYFLLSFMALVLIPATYYFWPRSEKRDNEKHGDKECHCEPCQRKRQYIKDSRPFRKAKRISLKVGILVAWIVFILVAYKTSQVELEWKEFDPYFELGIDREATVSEIRKAYRQLSLIYHPDKDTGDSDKFMKISKAYKALTNEEAGDNWRLYGNPDGPGATHFGIALPKWIVEKQNSVWVLGVYGLVFMIILPIAVGTWWYKSIKFSSEQILMDTARLYNIFLQKTPNMILKRVLMILGASFEFDKGHNNEIILRASDNEDIPKVMRYLPNLGEKNKERPLCLVYSIKARTMLHAHLIRLDTLSSALQQDRDYVIKKCPYLLNEMISIGAQHVALSHAGKARMPKLSTIENMMRISQMVTQALWEHSNPLLQLPHMTEDILKHFITKKRNIRSIEKFAMLTDEDRRLLLRTLTETEYQDVMIICQAMPYIIMDAHTEVKDDEDNNMITAGSIVTVTVSLTRKCMGDLMEDKFGPEPEEEEILEEKEEEEVEEKEELVPTNIGPGQDNAQRKPKVWEKQKKKNKSKASKSKKKPVKPLVNNKKVLPAPGAPPSPGKNADGDSTHSTPKRQQQPQEDPEDLSGVSSDEDMDTDATAGPPDDEKESGAPGGEVQDEAVWEEMQRDLRKENKLETKSKETHLVHCPYFPAEKFEWWWLYMADRKTSALITAPIHVCSLKDVDEFQLKFSAPSKPGNYSYTVILKSDSYLDFDVLKTIKLDVREARKIENVKQWDFTDDEEDKGEGDNSESDSVTDSEDDDY